MINDFHLELNEGDRQIGYVYGHYDDQGGVLTANITQIRVVEGCQSQGVGTKLIRKLEEWCIERGIVGIAGWIQSLDKERARAFYERNGFEVEENPFEEFEIFKEL